MRVDHRRLVFLIPLLWLPACATDSMEDRRHGQQIICHDGDETMAVSNADSFGHMGHGDSAGPCPQEK